MEPVRDNPVTIDKLHEIKADTLFIQGDKEWEDLSRISEHFKQVQSIRFIIVEGADHMVTLTHPKTIVNHINLFLHKRVLE
ncbi:alpha/beta fold hydrolase [Chengkuizengella sp. SCS-71B]|uniref:alpha/beta fold hydrolase n=1 Tax=Chengkuizengella sp. SCS-71B TaxID=3115290 RepID=UPI0032C217FB